MRIRKLSRLEPVELAFSPIEVARRLAHLEGFVFLDSSLPSHASLSIVGALPERRVEGQLPDVSELERTVASLSGAAPPDVGMPDGAAIGWFEYDGRYSFGIYHDLLIFSHRHEQWFARGNLLDALDEGAMFHSEPILFRAEQSREQFLEAVRQAQQYIAAGDIYQVCLAHRFVSEATGCHPWSFYEALRDYSPAPNGAYLDVGGGRTICSASPETFLRFSGREVETRPIKGTRPRRDSQDADERSAYELLTSQKEIAELVMITDLERNDLGRVCEYGSVRVTDLLRLERFEQVFHLVSTVKGTLREGVSQVNALVECFPGGSISGAPKVRAMQIIRELEPVSRGVYTGAIGYFGFNGESQFNIAIRTAEFASGSGSFHAGAGIVADSIPEREWEETLQKASGLILASERIGRNE